MTLLAQKLAPLQWTGMSRAEQGAVDQSGPLPACRCSRFACSCFNKGVSNSAVDQHLAKAAEYEKHPRSGEAGALVASWWGTRKGCARRSLIWPNFQTSGPFQYFVIAWGLFCFTKPAYDKTHWQQISFAAHGGFKDVVRRQ
jgi:hypothetical protein